ncbi:hypothetical protein P43SY_002504 [Pythium insidiosum]|uniref:Cytochrome b561 domain-containing protein n=1 Tax=Pythium insidiosum TaxID=114742 RepID=A0AAD5L7E1_PYTIN|nr:hypothetical protein P43SY_002504 [Pythium insidiosum]
MVKAIQLLAHALPLLAVVLVGVWMSSVLTQYVKTGNDVAPKNLSGFSWATGDGRVFNWHPLLMTLGFVFCSSQSALAYVSLPFTHETNKIIHLTLHAVGAISSLIGGIAVFRFHNEHNITNLYSLHSWLGVLTWLLFVAQWVFSFVTYFYPGAKPAVRAATITYHIGGGIGILALIYITAATGVLEKLSFNASCNISGTLNGQQVTGYMASDCVLGNVIGLVLAVSFVAVVATVVHAKLAAAASAQPVAVVRDETYPLVNAGVARDNQSNGATKAYGRV